MFKTLTGKPWDGSAPVFGICPIMYSMTRLNGDNRRTDCKPCRYNGGSQ